jgi:hypothetical protein
MTHFDAGRSHHDWSPKQQAHISPVSLRLSLPNDKWFLLSSSSIPSSSRCRKPLPGQRGRLPERRPCVRPFQTAAYQGKLVDQDRDGEPAGVLLERIEAEKEAMAPKRREPRPRRTGRKARRTP